MKKVLMILTHDRLDCLRITLEMLALGDSLRAFDKVVLLLNGVSTHHRRVVERFMAAHPKTSWDTLEGPGTRPAGLVGLQNRCVERYPDSLYVKLDDDVFVPAGWADRMISAYNANAKRDNLGLITPLIPNNSFGLHALLTKFYPSLLEEHRQRFGRDPSPERQSFTWHNPTVAEWATRPFLSLNEANEKHRKLLDETSLPRFIEFADPFSIGCICYDYRHWKKMGGVPPRDEPEWCDWIQSHHHVNILDCSQIVLHYSFFVQQDWLDRTSLLEDVRIANLPGTLSHSSLTGYHLPHWIRTARQVPRVLGRRLRALTGSNAG